MPLLRSGVHPQEGIERPTVVWRIRRLVEQLQARPLSSRELLPYGIFVVRIGTLSLVSMDWTRPWDRDAFEASFDSLTTLLNGVICLIGLGSLSRERGPNGIELLDRIAALGTVLMVRFVLATVVLVIILGIAVTYVHLLALHASYESLDLLSVPIMALFW